MGRRSRNTPGIMHASGLNNEYIKRGNFFGRSFLKTYKIGKNHIRHRCAIIIRPLFEY